MNRSSFAPIDQCSATIAPLRAANRLKAACRSGSVCIHCAPWVTRRTTPSAASISFGPSGHGSSALTALVLISSPNGSSNASTTRTPAMNSCVPGGWPSELWPIRSSRFGADSPARVVSKRRQKTRRNINQRIMRSSAESKRQTQDSARILVKNFSFNQFGWREPANRREHLRAAALVAFAGGIIAVTAIKQFLLMPFEKTARMFFVAEQRVEAGAGAHVPEHIRVVSEKFVSQAAGSDRPFRIHHRLFRLRIDICPPRLGMSDKVHPGIFFEHQMEPLEAGVVSTELEMQEDGHAEFLGNFRNQGDRAGVGFDHELLLANPDRACF